MKSFDLSDVDAADETDAPADKLDDVLAIATEVVAEYGETDARSRTRIERLAHWLIDNVGALVQVERVSVSGERYVTGKAAYPIVRVGGVFVAEKKTADRSTCHVGLAVGTDAALATAAALIRASESAG